MTSITVSQITKEVYSLCESVADLSAMFHAPKYAPLTPQDSRETVRLVIEWAQEFETLNAARDWDGEYMEEIEQFFERKYNEWMLASLPPARS